MKRINRVKGTTRFAFKSNKIAGSNKNKSFTIYLFFTYGVGKKIKISTGLKANYKDWDFNKQRFKNKASVLDYDQYNSKLITLEENINSAYAELSNDDDNFSPALLKAHYEKLLKNNDTNNVKERLVFVDIVDKFLIYKKGTINDVTLRSYKQASRLLKSYQKHHDTILECEDIDPSFHKSFVKYLQEEQGFKKNTIGKHIKTIKTFMNYALNEGYTTNQRFKSSEFKVPKEITTEIYLNDEEIKTMFEHDFSKYKDLEHARDIFLMGYYTGQRVSDYNSFSEDDIIEEKGVKYFKIIQTKNKSRGRLIYCPITTEMQEIMNKRHNGLPPKAITDKDLNLLIKEVGQELKLDSLKKLVKCTYTQGGEEITEYFPKYKLIKSHTARRSFATNMYKKGMPVYDIMFFTGHTTEKEFYKYIRIKDEERASHVVKSGFFNV